MKKKVIQIISPCWDNKGDRLMVDSLYQELGSRYFLPIPIWNMAPVSKFWSPINFYKMGLQQGKRFFQTIAHGKPCAFLDASGYQLGDPWVKMSTALSIRLTYYQYYKKKGVKLILLPQSIGPFKEALAASNAAGIFQLADLVFVRCEKSRQYALSVGCQESKLFLAPDYSNLVEPPPPTSPSHWKDVVCVVPSVRMLDKTPENVKDHYIEAIRYYIRLIMEQGLKPCFLVHQEEDLFLARKINNSLNEKISLLDPEPQEAKQILGACHTVIASRYHAIIGSLSQRTPCIGTGWIHKYQSLFAEYGCEHLLFSQFDSKEAIAESFRYIMDKENRANIKKALEKNGDEIRQKTREMYEKLIETIEK